MIFISRPDELLETHISLVINQYKQLIKYKQIDIRMKYIISQLCNGNKILNNQNKIIYDLFINTLKLHDEGKKNPYFQSYMENEGFKKYKYTKSNKHHSQISAIYYIIQMYEKHIVNNIDKLQIKIAEKSSIKKAIMNLILSFAYNIERHHQNLDDFNSLQFIEYLKVYYENNKDKFTYIDMNSIDYLAKFKGNSTSYLNPFTYYMLMKLSYSVLITCDFMAVYNFYTGSQLNINNIDDKIKIDIQNKFNNNEVIKNIRKFQDNNAESLSELDRYRCKIFCESEDLIMKNKQNRIHYFESPTGSGKSLTSLNLALKLLDCDIDRIIFVAPFNNISDQTYKVIKNTFYDDVKIVNSRQSITTSEGEDEEIDYDRDFLDYQMLNYPVTLISHVKLFDIFFNNSRINNLMLPNICNSVIIIDEVQSYKNALWIHIINSLKEFSEMLNLKIIIMSATLPKMEDLLEDNKYRISSLIKNTQQYYDFFKNRVTYNYDLLDICENKTKNTKEQVFNKIDEVIKTNNRHRILIETLTTATNELFYKEMKKYEKDGFLVFQMLSITNEKSREHIISIIQEKENNEYKNQKIILIGTECIEAGIDIDMNIGFKDISMLDSEEQFAGRIERNFFYTGIVYFFDIDNSDFIFKEDFRTEGNLRDKEWRKWFKEKSFGAFYKRNYKWLIEKKMDDYITYKKDLNNLQYIKINKTMKLIDSNTYNFLFMAQYEDMEAASEIFEEYLNVNKKDLKYSEKQIKIKDIKKKLNNYIYSINAFKFKADITYEKRNDLYIVSDGKQYFDNLHNNKLTKNSTLDLSRFISDSALFI
jgi:CRISPR-associated endonuclease/helicase Cas3